MTSNQSIDEVTLTTEADTSFADIEAKGGINKDILTLTVTPKFESIGMKTERESTQACVTIQASDMPENYEAQKSALDLVVALDVSGSMDGKKLSDCISTLKAMLRTFCPKDRFGLVTFGSHASVVIRPTLMTKANKASALNEIKALHTTGCTNLSGGLELAWQEMMQIEKPNAVRSIFLLTDGHANTGITTTTELVSMVRRLSGKPASTFKGVSPQLSKRSSSLLSKCFKRLFGSKRSSEEESEKEDLKKKAPKSSTLDKNSQKASTKAPSLICFGYGSDHNSEMLQAISEVTPGGAHYFVEKDSDVASAFGDAMGGLLSVLAQSAVLKITVPPAAAAMGVKISDVHHDEKIARGDGSYTVTLGDFYAEESRDVLLDLTLANKSSDDPIPHVQVSLSYMDIMNKKHAQAGPVDCSIKRPLDSQVSPMNLYVESQWVRVCTVREMEAAEAEAKAGRLDTARDRLNKELSVISKSPAYDQEDELMMSLESDVNLLMEGYESYKMYQTSGSHNSRNISRQTKMQRCMMSSAAAPSHYRTSAKQSMALSYAAKDD